MKEMVCIICPRGCRLTVDEETLEVKGNSCPRGEKYGRDEVTNPVRTVTGSVAIRGGVHAMLAVRTDRPVPKDKMLEVMSALHSFKVDSPVKHGQVLIENICNTGANVIASRDM